MRFSKAAAPVLALITAVVAVACRGGVPSVTTGADTDTEPAETLTADDTSGQITPESGSAQLTSEAA